MNTSFHGFMSGSEFHYVASTLKILRSTLKHGLFPLSGSALIGYFLVCDNMGDLEGAIRFANLGLRVLEERSDDKTPMCLNKFVKAFHQDGWNTDIKSTIKAYDEAYTLGMENGDFENGIMSCGAGYDHAFNAGYSLKTLDRKFAELVQKENVYHLESVKGISIPQWLPIRFLRGTIDMPIDINDWLDYDKEMRTDGSDNYALLYSFNSRLMYGVYWADYGFLSKLIPKYTEKVEDHSHSALGIRCSFLAIALSGLCRQTGKKEYLRKARKFAFTLKKYCEARGMNSWHRYLIAMAQIKACTSSNKAEILQEFDKAINYSTKRDHSHDAALASQLALEYISFTNSSGAKSRPRRQRSFVAMSLNCAASSAKNQKNSSLQERARGENLLILHYLEQALDGYAAWGADNLVSRLKRKYAEHLKDVLL